MFIQFSKAVHERFVEMSKRELFVVQIEDPFVHYLSYYPEGTNPLFRKRTVHDCSCCKNFIKNVGCLVNIVDGKIVTVWDDLDIPEPYKTVADKMSVLIKSFKIETVFRTKERKYGNQYNYDNVTNERHDHFYAEIDNRHHSLEPATRRGELEAIFQVMKRGLTEIKLHDLESVQAMINENQLYRGEEHKPAVVGFSDLLLLSQLADDLDLFVWENLHDRNARFRNTVIGTLLVDLAEGKDLDQAVKSFETKVAPANYKRPTAVITQKMVENAVQTLTDLGLGGAIYRRYARLSDVSVRDVLFVDNESQSKMKGGIAALLEGSVVKSTPDLKNAAKVSADYFVGGILPETKSLEVFVQNSHAGNFVSLTAAESDCGEQLFKWNNGFAWSYAGDVADSVKQRVKAAGGNVNAKLRVSLAWSNGDDLDVHCLPPNRKEIYFGDKQGILDVDMNARGPQSRNPVENLAFNRLEDGVYKVWVNQFNRRESEDFGFTIEVEFNGVVSQFSYDKMMKTGENVSCFNLITKKGALENIECLGALKGGTYSQDKWGVKTETLVPVNLVTWSPNHWGDEKVGNKHLIFALKNCKNPEATRGFYNEFLRGDLDKHRKVFEVLSAKSKCKFADDQISGLGFTSARGDSVTVVVNGRRSYTISF